MEDEQVDREFQDLLLQCQIPEQVKEALTGLGYDCTANCTLTFGGLAFSSMLMLDQNIKKFLPEGENDTTSPTCARIRALWSKCNALHTSPPIPAAQAFPPTPSPTPTTSPLNSTSNWNESLPPKLSTEDMAFMKTQFGKTTLEKYLMLIPHLRSDFGL